MWKSALILIFLVLVPVRSNAESYIDDFGLGEPNYYHCYKSLPPKIADLLSESRHECPGAAKRHEIYLNSIAYGIYKHNLSNPPLDYNLLLKSYQIQDAVAAKMIAVLEGGVKKFINVVNSDSGAGLGKFATKLFFLLTLILVFWKIISHSLKPGDLGTRGIIIFIIIFIFFATPVLPGSLANIAYDYLYVPITNNLSKLVMSIMRSVTGHNLTTASFSNFPFAQNVEIVSKALNNVIQVQFDRLAASTSIWQILSGDGFMWLLNIITFVFAILLLLFVLALYYFYILQIIFTFLIVFLPIPLWIACAAFDNTRFIVAGVVRLAITKTLLIFFLSLAMGFTLFAFTEELPKYFCMTAQAENITNITDKELSEISDLGTNDSFTRFYTDKNISEYVLGRKKNKLDAGCAQVYLQDQQKIHEERTHWRTIAGVLTMDEDERREIGLLENKSIFVSTSILFVALASLLFHLSCPALASAIGGANISAVPAPLLALLYRSAPALAVGAALKGARAGLGAGKSLLNPQSGTRSALGKIGGAAKNIRDSATRMDM